MRRSRTAIVPDHGHAIVHCRPDQGKFQAFHSPNSSMRGPGASAITTEVLGVDGIYCLHGGTEASHVCLANASPPRLPNSESDELGHENFRGPSGLVSL